MAKPKPYITLDLRCSCGATLYVELPQEAAAGYLSEKLFTLTTRWTEAHAAHHQEPKK
jgi:hypothetical protein